MTKLIDCLLTMVIVMLVTMAEFELFVNGIYEPFQLSAGIAIIVLAWSMHLHAAKWIKAKYF